MLCRPRSTSRVGSCAAAGWSCARAKSRSARVDGRRRLSRWRSVGLARRSSRLADGGDQRRSDNRGVTAPSTRAPGVARPARGRTLRDLLVHDRSARRASTTRSGGHARVSASSGRRAGSGLRLGRHRRASGQARWNGTTEDRNRAMSLGVVSVPHSRITPTLLLGSVRSSRDADVLGWG